MTWISAALLSIVVLSPQDPTVRAPSPGRDVVILKSGERLEGKIVEETAEYVQISLGEGTVVGFSKSKTESIQRDVPPAAPAGETVPAGVLKERDQWFVLVNGEGGAVGWLHSSVTHDDQGGTRIGEEWEFTEDRRKTAVTILEVLDADRRPLSCYYHERSTRVGDERIRDERIVRGGVLEGKLEVQRMSSANQRSEEVYEFPAGTRFPLELSEELRQELGGTPEGDVYKLYDPRSDEFVMRNLGIGRWRDIEIDGETQRVRELVAETAAGTNSEWLDASTIVLRREINGPALVAVPSTENSARGQATSHRQVLPSSRRNEPDNRFSLWLPNPLWAFEEESVKGQVVARSRIHDARVGMVLLDYMDRDLLLESVVDAVVKMHRLMDDGFELRLRSPVRVRGRGAVRLEALHREGETTYQSVLYVMPCAGSFAMFTCRAPEASYAELEADFERILSSMELDPGGVAPKVPELLKIKRSGQDNGH